MSSANLAQTLVKVNAFPMIIAFSNSAWQQLGIIGAKIREIIMILGAKTWKIIKILVEENKLLLENMATATWYIRDLMVDNVSEAQWLLKNMTTATWYVRDLLLHYVGEAVRVVIEVFTCTPCEMELGEHVCCFHLEIFTFANAVKRQSQLQQTTIVFFFFLFFRENKS